MNSLMIKSCVDKTPKNISCFISPFNPLMKGMISQCTLCTAL